MAPEGRNGKEYLLLTDVLKHDNSTHNPQNNSLIPPEPEQDLKIYALEMKNKCERETKKECCY